MGTGALKEWLLIEPSLYAAGNGDKWWGAAAGGDHHAGRADRARRGGDHPLFRRNRPFVDLLGKNDKVIGHGDGPDHHPGVRRAT